MCEETENYLWGEKDVLGRGATSQVYKAYNKQTGELVAAKVYPVASTSRSQPGANQYNREKDFRRILDREMDILKDTKHENIVRYIGVESVKCSDSAIPVNARDALFIEYCNGGSLHNVLESGENRFGLMDDEFMLVFKNVTNALRYLRDQNTIHRDIKPDNIMLSINVNGERTYKLADLGVARLINEGENTFTSIVGTEEYIHPALYQVAVPEKDTRILPTTFQPRARFPFEVDLWSFGVTLYQCATGELPFQPFAGTRKDRTVMRKILDSKPSGVISGIETSSGSDITWSRTLPNTCRLSPCLKRRLESLLPRLLESQVDKLMPFKDFFDETDRILNLIPIHYLNLKHFQLACTFLEPNQSILTLYDKLLEQNGDESTVKYNCLFQNVPYPISKTKPMSIQAFCNQLPMSTSRENPLVFYTFSPLNDDDPHTLTLQIPQMKAVRQDNDVSAVCDWAKDIVGLFFYIKDQLFQYQHIIQTAQSSMTMMQLHLRSELLEFLCTIRDKLIIFRNIEELQNTLDEIDGNSSGTVTPASSLSTSLNNANQSNATSQSASEDLPPIRFSHILTNPSPAVNISSPDSIHRPTSASSMQLVQESIRVHLRTYRKPYEELQKCEQCIVDMIQKQSSSNLVMMNDQQLVDNTLWSPENMKIYSSQIRRTDKFLRDLTDLYESFCQDRLLSTYNRLQVSSHFIRRNKFQVLYKDYIAFTSNECLPTLNKISQDYNRWIKQCSAIINEYERIQPIYEKQTESMMSYAQTIEFMRTTVYKKIRELSTSTASLQVTNELPPSVESSIPNCQAESTGSTQQATTNPEHELTSKTFVHKIRGTTKKTIEHAEESLNKLDDLIKQLHTTMHKK